MDHGPRFQEIRTRGKGSERMIYHPDVAGRSESYPIKCHGEGTAVAHEGTPQRPPRPARHGEHDPRL